VLRQAFAAGDAGGAVIMDPKPHAVGRGKRRACGSAGGTHSSASGHRKAAPICGQRRAM